MFKSCQYCRHRKKKCTFPEGSSHDARCYACQRVGVACEIATRHKSLKRQRTSQQAASCVRNALEQSYEGSIARPGTILVGMENGDCQIPRPGASSEHKQLLIPTVSTTEPDLTLRRLYELLIRPECPFISETDLEPPTSPALAKCIQQAARLSFSYSIPGLPVHERSDTDPVFAGPYDLPHMAGLLLLLARQRLDQFQTKLIFDSFVAIRRSQSIPKPVLVGALVAETWHCLVGSTLPGLAIPVDELVTYASQLDETTFGPHFLKLTHLGASLLQLQRDNAEQTSKLVPSWARFEYSCLLSVVEMHSEFLDVRDDMPATPAAVITHMLQNLIYLRLYTHLLCEKPALGQKLALRPVPGVLHFLCAIARSTFICQPQVFEYWPLAADFQAVAAHVMLSLWDLTNSENCRALLNLWKPKHGHDALMHKVREVSGNGPWAVEVIDGYSVFWTFRDVRSLILESIIHN